MPCGDGSGPLGQGPMTGRGLGICGRGFRRLFGRGYGKLRKVASLTEREFLQVF